METDHSAQFARGTAGPVGSPGGFGKYHLIAEVAHGGMGIIYLAVARGPVGATDVVAGQRPREVA